MFPSIFKIYCCLFFLSIKRHVKHKPHWRGSLKVSENNPNPAKVSLSYFYHMYLMYNPHNVCGKSSREGEKQWRNKSMNKTTVAAAIKHHFRHFNISGWAGGSLQVFGENLAGNLAGVENIVAWCCRNFLTHFLLLQGWFFVLQ